MQPMIRRGVEVLADVKLAVDVCEPASHRQQPRHKCSVFKLLFLSLVCPVTNMPRSACLEDAYIVALVL